MDDKELVARLRRGFKKPDGAKRRPSPRELEAADRIEALSAKAEALAEALELAEDVLERVTMHHPDTPGLGYDNERALVESAAGIANGALEPVRAALKAWEATPPASPE